jgi:hypothetical protein
MWLYNGVEVTEEQTAGYIGFVYIITDLLNGKRYVGKKLFSKAGYKQVKGKRKKIRKPSDWETYFGSCQELNDRVSSLGPNVFKREILHFCKSKAETTYLELREQIDRRVLESDEFYNQWIMARIRKSHLKDYSGN